MDANKVTRFLLDVWRGIYGDSTPDSIFNGGNVGLIQNGLSIEKSAETLATAINNHANAINYLGSVIEKRLPTQTKAGE